MGGRSLPATPRSTDPSKTKHRRQSAASGQGPSCRHGHGANVIPSDGSKNGSGHRTAGEHIMHGVIALALVLTAVCVSSAAAARVERIELLSRQPFAAG